MRRPIRAKFCTVISTRPNFIMHVQNFREELPSKILGAKNMQNLARLRRLGGWVQQNQISNFCPLTTKLQARMLTYPKWTLCVLRMLMHLSSGRVTLPHGEFHPSPPEISPNQT